MKKAFKTILRTYMPEKIRVRLSRFGRSMILFPRAFSLWIKYLRSPHYFLPREFISNVKLSFPEFYLYMLDGWYHDFEALGLKTGILHPNQRCKQGPLFELITRSISLCRERSSSIRGVDLFCADGYYTNYAVTYGVQEMYGIDHNNLYQE